jgi:hypothetical protein
MSVDNDKFREDIEEIVWMLDVSYLEAILIYTEERDMLPDQLGRMAKFVFGPELEAEARKRHLLKK